MNRDAVLNALAHDVRVAVTRFCDSAETVNAGDVVLTLIEVGLAASVKIFEVGGLSDPEVLGYEAFMNSAMDQIATRSKGSVRMVPEVETKPILRKFDA